MIASRLALASARPLARRSIAQQAPRRFQSVSTSGSSHAGKPLGGDPKSSDLPWALGSAIVFGSALIYVTSPSSTHNEHGQVDPHKPKGHGEAGRSRSDDKTGKNAVWLTGDDNGAQSAEDVHEDDAPDGDKHLIANSRRGDPHQQKTKEQDKTASEAGVMNSNFKHGVAASKDGKYESNPKEVVAKAQADKQAKAAQKKAEKEGTSNEQPQDSEGTQVQKKDDDGEGEQEDKKDEEEKEE